MQVQGPAGRSVNWSSRRDRGRASVLRQMQCRIHAGIEIQMELRMELVILDQCSQWTCLREAIFRSRISAKDIFRATTGRLSPNVNGDVSETGVAHNLTPV